MIVAIDGPSGTGKSTVAKGVAKKLGFAFFDTGAMYRSLAWWLQHVGVDPDNEEAVKGQLRSFQYDIQSRSNGEKVYFVQGIDVTEAIRSHEISSVASKIAMYPDVRKSLVAIQRAFGSQVDAVFEGRDMGTIVFPCADVKIFLTANAQVRAGRRYQELLQKNPRLVETLSCKRILQDIEERDHADTTRSISPLKQAADAILIDTSDLTQDEVIERINAIVQSIKPVMKRLYAFVYFVVRLYCKIFYRLKIYGLEHFRSGKAMIASNHDSNLDPLVVSISCPEEVHFLAKEALFKVPILGWLIRHLNAHPVTRDAADITTFRLVVRLLQKGEKIILFPEGRRSDDGGLHPIERGLAFLASKAGAAIQPVYLQGTFNAWPRQRSFPKMFGNITCVFGSPIPWEEFEGLEKKEMEKRVSERVEEAWHSLKAWVEAGASGPVP